MIYILPWIAVLFILTLFFGWKNAIGLLTAFLPILMAVYFVILKIDQKRKINQMED